MIKKNFKKRLAKLVGGVAVLKVIGGATEVEVKEKKRQDLTMRFMQLELLLKEEL